MQCIKHEHGGDNMKLMDLGRENTLKLNDEHPALSEKRKIE